MESETISNKTAPAQIVGRISQIIGPVVDVAFDGPENEIVLPRIHDAMEIKRDDGRTLIVEIQQHIGENTVRTVAMDSTDGLRRGMKAVSHFRPITMPVGEQIKGRLMNVVGETIDGMKELDHTGAYPIHRDPPKFDELTTSQEVLYTGIKGIPSELYEAARMDGASELQMAFRITMPLLKSTAKVSITFAIIGSLKMFDLIWVLTKGGPLHASEVPSTLMYTTIFNRLEYGSGSAIAIFIVLECLLFYFLLEKFVKVDPITY